MTASDRNLAIDSWFVNVSLSSDKLQTQVVSSWGNKKYKIGFPEEFSEDGGTSYV
jgi:hypothetical protein